MNELIKTEAGQKMLAALRAVARFHSDTSKLLVDCDKYVGKGRKSLFGSYATRDLSYHVKADFWMPEGLFRYYDSGRSLVDGVGITLFNAAGNSDPEYETEPLFMAARIQYKTPEADAGKSVDGQDGLKTICDGWDIWWLFFEANKTRAVRELLEYADVDQGRIVWARLIAVPLFSINRIEDVLDLMAKIDSVSVKS
jgi:hypothetical protein